jgi:hypothetical protein
MQGLENLGLQCPYCGENIEVLVDRSEGDHEYIEDCSVCCRPIVLTVSGSGSEELVVSARREDD